MPWFHWGLLCQGSTLLGQITILHPGKICLRKPAMQWRNAQLSQTRNCYLLEHFIPLLHIVGGVGWKDLAKASPIPFAPPQFDKQESCCFRGTELADQVLPRFTAKIIKELDIQEINLTELSLLMCTTLYCTFNQWKYEGYIPAKAFDFDSWIGGSIITKKWLKTPKWDVSPVLSAPAGSPPLPTAARHDRQKTTACLKRVAFKDSWRSTFAVQPAFDSKRSSCEL